MNQLKSAYLKIFEGIKTIHSEKISLMREYIPKLYNKHSVERAKRVSAKEREEKKIIDESYAYGEISCEVLATIYTKVSTTYGVYPREHAVFYDLGCGVGNLVYAAAIIGTFRTAAGMESIGALVERAQRRMKRWDLFRRNMVPDIRDVLLTFIQDDLYENADWTRGTFLLLHWTAMSHEQRLSLSRQASQCSEGSFCIAFTYPLESSEWELLVRDACNTSWGTAEFFVQEKVTPASIPPQAVR